MIFSELYSAYYNTVAKIMEAAFNPEATEKDLQRCVMEDTGITLSEIQSQGQRNSRWQRVVIAVHGSGCIHYCQRISVVTEVGK